MKMDLSAVGYVIWGSACLLGLATILLLGRPCGFVARSYLLYLLSQTITSSLWLATHFIANASSWLEWAFWQTLLVAGCAYVAIGVSVAVAVFAEEGQVKLLKRGLALGWLLAFGVSTVLLSLQLVGTSPSAFGIVVFVFYLPAAALALVGLLVVWWKKWPPVERSTFLSCISCTTIRRVSAVAAIVGMIDFLFPAFEYVGLPLWESTFLTRLLDSVVYLPGIIPWIVWMDGQVDVKDLSLSSEEESERAEAARVPS